MPSNQSKSTETVIHFLLFIFPGDNLVIGSYDSRMSWFDLDLSTKPYQTLKYVHLVSYLVLNSYNTVNWLEILFWILGTQYLQLVYIRNTLFTISLY